MVNITHKNRFTGTLEKVGLIDTDYSEGGIPKITSKLIFVTDSGKRIAQDFYGVVDSSSVGHRMHYREHNTRFGEERAFGQMLVDAETGVIYRTIGKRTGK